MGLEGSPVIVPGLSHMVGVDWQSAAPGAAQLSPCVLLHLFNGANLDMFQ